jgi:hypothetical protein
MAVVLLPSQWRAWIELANPSRCRLEEEMLALQGGAEGRELRLLQVVQEDLQRGLLQEENW